jgi:hypothetical protein
MYIFIAVCKDFLDTSYLDYNFLLQSDYRTCIWANLLFCASQSASLLASDKARIFINGTIAFISVWNSSRFADFLITCHLADIALSSSSILHCNSFLFKAYVCIQIANKLGNNNNKKFKA